MDKDNLFYLHIGWVVITILLLFFVGAILGAVITPNTPAGTSTLIFSLPSDTPTKTPTLTPSTRPTFTSTPTSTKTPTATQTLTLTSTPDPDRHGTTPSPPATQDIFTFNMYGGSDSGNVSPYSDKWYIFFERADPGPLFLLLMFDPNPNLNGKEEVKFFIYDEGEIPVWPPKDSNLLLNLGAGSSPGFDRDGDLGNGELIWQGGPLQRNRRYYVRIVNGSTNTLQYCLTTQNVYEWSCSR